MNIITFNLHRNACRLLFHKHTTPKTSDISSIISRYGKSPFPVPPFNEKIPAEEVVRCNVSLDSAARLTIGSLSEQLDLPPSKTVQSLVMETARRGGFTRTDGSSPDTFSLFSSQEKRMDVRPEQALFHRFLMDSLKKGRIGMIEASTGSGKTIAMISAAIDILQKKSGRVVLAVPTLSVLDHFVREYERISPENRQGIPVLRVLIGQNEFVSEKEMKRFLEDAEKNGETAKDAGKWIEEIGKVREWVNADAPPPESRPRQHHWLVSSLSEISPEFPVDEIRLSRDKKVDREEDEGYLAYRAQFTAEDAKKEIVICTHAMVAMDILRRRASIGKIGHKLLADPNKELNALFEKMADLKKEGEKKKSGKLSPEEEKREEEQREDKRKDLSRQIEEKKAEWAKIIDECATQNHIPPFDYLIVDEAHSFEQSVSSALSEEISLRSLSRKLEEAGMSKNKRNDFRKMVERLRDLAETDSGEIRPLVIPRHEEATSILHGIIALISGFVGKSRKKKKDDPEKQAPLMVEVNKILTLMTKGASPEKNIRSEIRFSPVREYPRLVFGKKTVQGDLTFLWETVKAGACVSASLYLPSFGGVSGKMTSRILGIPEGRLQEHPPIVCPWIYDSVHSVFIPGPVQSPKFFTSHPPSRSEKLKPEQRECRMDQWIGDVVPILCKIHKTAAGGVIVLLTSYERTDKFFKSLLPEIGEKALLVASPDFPLREQKKEFERLTLSGVRPLWLAVGSAWTGLDVNGEALGMEKDRDNVLTDLVIPGIPYGTNQSVTHVHRLSSIPEVPWDKYHTYMLMKQAIGRLVRRSGTPRNRRIFILDGRLGNPKMAGYTSDIKSLLLPYGDRVLTLEKTGGNIRRV